MLGVPIHLLVWMLGVLKFLVSSYEFLMGLPKTHNVFPSSPRRVPGIIVGNKNFEWINGFTLMY